MHVLWNGRYRPRLAKTTLVSRSHLHRYALAVARLVVMALPIAPVLGETESFDPAEHDYDQENALDIITYPAVGHLPVALSRRHFSRTSFWVLTPAGVSILAR